jgi:hypothetical protein
MSWAITERLLGGNVSDDHEPSKEVIQGWAKRIPESWISNVELRKDVQASDPAQLAGDSKAPPSDVDASGRHGASAAVDENRISLEMENAAVNVARQTQKGVDLNSGRSPAVPPNWELSLKRTSNLETLYEFVHSAADAAPATPTATNK